MTDINHCDALSKPAIILTGDLSRRIKKYATEEERQRAKLLSYKKYASSDIIY